VYHTNYFLQRETVDAMSRWLALPSATPRVVRSHGAEISPA
jgi:hypothetical protein